MVFSILVVALLLGAAGTIAWLRPARTAPITDARGRPVTGSIAVLEKVTIGGVEQSLLIRGLSVANPVLLYLHGGPGTSELGMVRVHNLAALEKHFTVVIWDQRGAGKSFGSRHPASGMTVEQFIADTRDVSAMLCRRFGQSKIFLVGHSWGSLLGVLTAARYPELFHAYVGIGQAVAPQEGERVSYEWTLAQAEKAGDTRSVAKLKRLGAPPYRGDLRASVVAERTVLARYGGEVHNNPRGGVFVLLGCLLKATEYSWSDRINVFRGIFATMEVMFPQILPIDLVAQVPELKVPVYFLEGRHDHEAPSVLAERYHEVLRAPRKTLVWFENSAHFVNTEEADAFHRVLIERVLPETLGRP